MACDFETSAAIAQATADSRSACYRFKVLNAVRLASAVALRSENIHGVCASARVMNRSGEGNDNGVIADFEARIAAARAQDVQVNTAAAASMEPKDTQATGSRAHSLQMLTGGQSAGTLSAQGVQASRSSREMHLQQKPAGCVIRSVVR